MMMEDDGGVAERVYAAFSSDAARKSASITLSNGNLTAALNNNSHNNVYLNMDKTSGRWACEFINLAAFSGSKVSSFGLATKNSVTGDLTLGIKLGTFQYGVGYQPFDGSRNKYTASEGYVLTAGVWRTVSAINTKHLVVFDFDNKQIYCPNPTNTGLLSSSIGAISTNVYPCLSMYGLATSTLLNSGQSAFTTTHENWLVALDLLLGGTTNRGFWT